MSNVAKRPNRTPRRVREKRANQLVLIGSIAGLIAVVGFLLALFTSFPGWVVFVAAVVAVVCGVLFRRMVTPR
jgi:membrane protein YdbS with pleckstrin-like domain